MALLQNKERCGTKSDVEIGYALRVPLIPLGLTADKERVCHHRIILI